MKNLIFIFSLIGLLPTYLQAQQAGSFGLGVNIGVPFGLSTKYFLDQDLAIDGALGAQGSSFDVHSDFLVHLRELWPNPSRGQLPAHLGLGLKIKGERETLFGIRFVGGLAYWLDKQPLEFFAEIAPVLRLAPSVGSNLDGGVGVRYYFGLRK